VVDAAVHLQEHRTALERDLGVCVRIVDDARRSFVRDVQELAAIASGRDVGDDVELLSGLAERALERLVEEGRDDQLVGQPACAQDRGQ
jgi:hypothetical protein